MHQPTRTGDAATTSGDATIGTFPRWQKETRANLQVAVYHRHASVSGGDPRWRPRLDQHRSDSTLITGRAEGAATTRGALTLGIPRRGQKGVLGTPVTGYPIASLCQAPAASVQAGAGINEGRPRLGGLGHVGCVALTEADRAGDAATTRAIALYRLIRGTRPRQKGAVGCSSRSLPPTRQCGRRRSKMAPPAGKYRSDFR